MSWVVSNKEEKKERSQNRNVSLLSPGEELTHNLHRSLEDDELNPNLYRRRSVCVRSQEEEYDGLDNRNPNLNRSRILSMRPLEDRFQLKPDPNPNETWRTPRDRNDLIQMIGQLKKRPPKGNNVFDSAAADVELRSEDYNNVRGFVYIEEALKGAEMNPTWRRNIFSQRPEDDDEELRQQIDNIIRHYDTRIAHQYWDHERYCILEQRQYDRDISATGGFEVGYYPYLMRSCCGGLIIRYYCPPDANLSHNSIAHLYALALHAIQFYNSKHQKCYSAAKVIKTMTSTAAGTWYYMTFQASNGDHLCTFEAKLFESIPCPHPNIEVSFVRLKMEPGSSSAASFIQEPQEKQLF